MTERSDETGEVRQLVAAGQVRADTDVEAVADALIGAILYRVLARPTTAGALTPTRTVVVALTAPQRVSPVWSGTPSWDSSGYVMTVRPNGSGNTFGFTTMLSAVK